MLQLESGPGGVSARVQGSRPTPYKVNIRFRPLTEAKGERVIEEITQQAIYAAKLLAGEMPADIKDVFAACGASLFPDKAKHPKTSCSCPDWANPCKHVATMHYLLCERF